MQNHQGTMHRRDDQEGRPPSSRTAPRTIRRRRRGPTRRGRRHGETGAAFTPRHLTAAHRCPHHHPARPPSQGAQQLEQPGEPSASPRGRGHRDVATWTCQDGVDPPVAYVSARPWRRQERARIGTPPARLYRLFQGRTVEDADRRANGACFPVPAGTRLCECGAVVVHCSHELGKLHRRRTEGALPPGRETPQDPPRRRGQGHAGAGGPGGGFRPVAACGGLRPSGRRESARRAASGRHLSGGAGGGGDEDRRGHHPGWHGGGGSGDVGGCCDFGGGPGGANGGAQTAGGPAGGHGIGPGPPGTP
ncbi:hypothetical protein MTO96_038101 [Rhipicephalus appendiculatus]